METQTALDQIRALAEEFAQQRGERQLRRELDRADFERLAAAGFLRATVPIELGGSWQNRSQSTRVVCDLLRTIAHGDSSVALVCAMHPVVLSYWLATATVPEPHTEAWAEQQRFVFQSALDGHWWGTITSEPGSGGEITRTAATARLAEDGGYRIGGRKQFGSGLGICSYMITTAIPDGQLDADWFYLDLRGAPWERDEGVRIVAPWDGHGMIASQSHAVLFEDYPAMRLAWPGHLRQLLGAAAPFILCCFAAVFAGIVEVAMETAHRHLATRQATLRAFERVEWSRAEMDAWLLQQAFEGMLRAVEQGQNARQTTLIGKTVIAELAESALARVCRVLGGGTYARYAPFGFWFEDVRALGFLRPPWGLAYEYLFEGSWRTGVET